VGMVNWLPSLEALNRWAEGVKSGSITLLAVGAAAMTGMGIFTAVTSDSVTVEPIKVPPPFEERGFNSEIATAQLLDEITTYQSHSSSAKERVSIMGKGHADELGKLQASVAGLDISKVQSAIQDLLGVKQEKITGEITFKKEGDEVLYHVRMRRLPGNHVLLDIKVKGEPQAVLKKTAVAMIEVFDPHIAASIYYREGDIDNALRLIEVVLSNDRTDDDKYALNLDAYINIGRKNYDAAQADFDRIMHLDPKFAPAHGMAAWLNRAKQQYDASLVEADKAIQLAPDKWWGYSQKAQTLRDLKREDEAEASFAKTLSLKPDAPGPFIQASQFMASRNKLAESGDICRKGLLHFPENTVLHVNYADILKRTGQPEHALKEFLMALELDPNNQVALAGKAELDSSSPKARKDKL
jgi:tetratricopeptide (TPR) repeat protein